MRFTLAKYKDDEIWFFVDFSAGGMTQDETKAKKFKTRKAAENYLKACSEFRGLRVRLCPTD